MSAQANLDGRGSEILAAAITLRDIPGHQTLRAMCRVWCVQRPERVPGKWKDRSVATLHGLLTCSVCMAAARWHPEAPRQTEQLGVSGYASSGSSRAGPEHRGVTEHVSPGCSATGPQQSGQIHRRVSPVCNDDDDSDGHSDRRNWSSDSDDEKEEGDVQLNSMMAIVSCPQYDWRCSTCHKCVNEVDKSRRWVDPRPCQKCKKPMETWRTRESICPIFKPEGSAPSARELKVHRDRS